jgi:hypothetical protein
VSDFALPALVLADETVGGMVCAWAISLGARGQAAATTPSLLWSPGPAAAAEAIARQSAVTGLRLVREPAAIDPRDLTAVLLSAVRAAGRLGLDRVLWPVLGQDPLGSDAPERAKLVSQLAAFDAPEGRSIRVLTPLADLTDAQVLELALDLDSPLDAGACVWTERERWGAAWCDVAPQHPLAKSFEVRTPAPAALAHGRPATPGVVVMPVAGRRSASDRRGGLGGREGR